jgi:hypothetical protein
VTGTFGTARIAPNDAAATDVRTLRSAVHDAPQRRRRSGEEVLGEDSRAHPSTSGVAVEQPPLYGMLVDCPVSGLVYATDAVGPMPGGGS